MRNRILHFFWEFSISIEERSGKYGHVNTAKNNTVYLNSSVQLHTGVFEFVDVSFISQIYGSLAPPCGNSGKRALTFCRIHLAGNKDPTQSHEAPWVPQSVP